MSQHILLPWYQLSEVFNFDQGTTSHYLQFSLGSLLITELMDLFRLASLSELDRWGLAAAPGRDPWHKRNSTAFLEFDFEYRKSPFFDNRLVHHILSAVLYKLWLMITSLSVNVATYTQNCLYIKQCWHKHDYVSICDFPSVHKEKFLSCLTATATFLLIGYKFP